MRQVDRGKYRGMLVDSLTGAPIDVADAEHFYLCDKCGCLVGERTDPETGQADHQYIDNLASAMTEGDNNWAG